MKNKSDILSEEIKSALHYNTFCYRMDANKSFAHALILGKITSAKLSESYYIGEKPTVNSLLLTNNSIITYFKPLDDNNYSRPILYQILEHLNIPFSGCADNSKGYAQASWLNCTLENDPNVDIYYKHINLPLVICYFDTIKFIQ